MATIKLTTGMAHSSHHYVFHLGNRVTVGEIAQYLSQSEPHLAVNTLELARPVQGHQRLQDVDIQVGDRLVAFLQPAKRVELPKPPSPGDKILKFSLADLEIDSRGKTGILVGKPDESQEMMPDIDLRYFVAPESLVVVCGLTLTSRVKFGTPPS